MGKGVTRQQVESEEGVRHSEEHGFQQRSRNRNTSERSPEVVFDIPREDKEKRIQQQVSEKAEIRKAKIRDLEQQLKAIERQAQEDQLQAEGRLQRQQEGKEREKQVAKERLDRKLEQITLETERKKAQITLETEERVNNMTAALEARSQAEQQEHEKRERAIVDGAIKRLYNMVGMDAD